jgi:23S rRNA (adenine2030-N6)-methyltransferase
VLSYQHIYHAGNRADLHKHGLLVWLLTYLVQKEKPASYVDVFAGRGFYDLRSAAARKTGEGRTGIASVFAYDWPDSLAPWKTLLEEINPKGGLRYYGGSPWLASKLLRQQDKLFLCDLHPIEYNELKELFKVDSRINLHQRHAHEALAGLLPPTPRRGLVLIDPSYEVKAEYEQMTELLNQSLRKWPSGCFVLWYPLLDGGQHQTMLRDLQSLEAGFLCGEWRWRESWHEETQGMLGSGLLVFNPPWQAGDFLMHWQNTLCGWFPGSRASMKTS